MKGKRILALMNTKLDLLLAGRPENKTEDLNKTFDAVQSFKASTALKPLCQRWPRRCNRKLKRHRPQKRP